MPWDLFCRVVDNFGDIGVCWRLAVQLAERGLTVRLWTDDASALQWLAPDRERSQPRVAVLAWHVAADPAVEPGEVVIEAFGCDPPPAFVARMAQRGRRGERPPVWINLEYLSAEAHVERSHGLPSPQTGGPGAGLVKTFFFPGFGEASGGLLRERDLLRRQAAFDAAQWLAARDLVPRDGERPVSLFCYPHAPVAALIERLAAAARPTLLLATPGAATAAVSERLGTAMRLGPLRAVALPWLGQPDYDHLLWSCEINWVRGEDSAVRAQWAARPFVWQFYRQHDAAEQPKLEAFLRRFFASTMAPAPLVETVTAWWRAWNAPLSGPAPPLPRELPDAAPWQAVCAAWRDRLCEQSGLVDRLQAFVRQAS